MEVSKITQILDIVLEAVALASKGVMEIYNSKEFAIEDKEDGSPVTLADKRSHEILLSTLESLDEGIPILSEEGDAQNNLSNLFWLRNFLSLSFEEGVKKLKDELVFLFVRNCFFLFSVLTTSIIPKTFSTFIFFSL